MSEIDNCRSAFRDALGNPIPLESELRVWLDDDLEDRRAPEGWTHMRTAREVCMLILEDRVVELSVDNDLDGDIAFGQGCEVIDFLEEMHGVHGRPPLAPGRSRPPHRESRRPRQDEPGPIQPRKIPRDFRRGFAK